METFVGGYFKISKWLLMVVGLWIDDSNFKRRISAFIWMILHLTLMVPMFLGLIQEWNDFTIKYLNIMYLLYQSGVVTKYLFVFFNIKRIRLLLIQVVEDSSKIVDKFEREILKQHYEEGRKLVLFYTGYIFSTWAIYSFIPFVPYVLDQVFPLDNKTRPIWIPFYADFVFFDQLQYHYPVNVYAAFEYGADFFMVCGIDAIFVLTVKHACGLFAITCYRILNILKFGIDKNGDATCYNTSAIQNCFKKAIVLHNISIRCSDSIEKLFNIYFILYQSMVTMGLGIGTVMVLHLRDDVFNSSRLIAVLIGLTTQLFIFNWFGQQIIDSSGKVFDSIYFSDWYCIPLPIRKLIIITMMRSLRPCCLTIGKIAILSMESFALVLKTSASYFTVLYSLV